MHISNVSRELRTPLNGIIGLSDALLSDPATRLEDTQLTHCLRVIRDSGARLNMLVNNLLDNATLAQRELKLSFGPVKLYNCIKDVLPLVTPLLSPAVTMVTDMPKKLPPVRGNQDRLVQVFFNIMGNAVKFCRHGTITVRGYVSEGFVKVEVVDTGEQLCSYPSISDVRSLGALLNGPRCRFCGYFLRVKTLWVWVLLMASCGNVEGQGM